ncbi:MAG: hypothetical protein AAGA60_31770 [Cyanobacteria bacterium P01_E01_bin.42]
MEIQPGDVVQSEQTYSFYSKTTMTGEELMAKMVEMTRHSSFTQPFPAKYLSCEGGNWQQGSVKLVIDLKLEFIPDEPRDNPQG